MSALPKLLFALWLALALAACVHQVTAPTTPQQAINEANIELTAAARVITQNVKDGVYTKAEAQSYLDRVRKLSERVDAAQALVTKGMPDAAQQVDIVRSLVLSLHREVVAKVRSTP